MEVRIADSYQKMSAEAARLVAEVVNTKPNAVLGLPTGSTPLGLYQELIRLHRDEGLDFAQVRTFNLDEYVGLRADDPRSYHSFMRQKFFDHVNVPRENVYIPSGTTQNSASFCGWYEDRIRECGGIDLQVLGIGTDGHIAFNEPGSSLSSRTRLKTLSKSTIKDNARHFDGEGEVPIYAITMGVGTILEARSILLLANGSAKARAVARAIEGPVTSMVAASALQLHASVRFLLDREAAADLEMKDYWEWVQAKHPQN
jgi:glucosamine-6-phosphate deaminase